MGTVRNLLLRNGLAYALAGGASLLCISAVVTTFGSVRLVPEDRVLGFALAVMGLGAISYFAASIWFIPRDRRVKILSTLNAWRFAEFAAAGLGTWVGFVASAVVWNLLFGETYGFVAWLVFAFLAILPTGFCSVHGVFLLHAFARKLRV